MYSGRKTANNQSQDLSIEKSIDLANALKEAGKVPPSMYVRNIQLQEEDHTFSRKIKYTKGNFIKSGTNFSTQHQTNINTLEITDKAPLEKVILSENLKEYHQTKRACPLLYNPRLY